MKKTISFIFTLIGILFVVALIVMFLARLIGLIPSREFEVRNETSPQPIQQSRLEVSYEQLAYKIIECESNWRPDVYGDNGRAYGLAQFHKPTFYWLSKLAGKDLDYYEPQHQIELLIWALENGRGYLWSCYKQIILN